MKNNLLLPALLFCSLIFAQDLSGSWKLIEDNGTKIKDQEVFAIVQDDYVAVGAKNAASNEFLYTFGGELDIEGSSLKINFDFHSGNPALIGKPLVFEFQKNGNLLTLLENGSSMVWEQISSEENELSGNWVITGRKRNGEMNTMTPGDRRTIKILGGDRFQWVAFNSATGEFSGTGGGTYTAKDGTYIENIDFFSRDKNRVGAELQFQFSVEDGKWHHSGKSSKGHPIYEIWSPYKEAYQK